jgi:hypothetical protein
MRTAEDFLQIESSQRQHFEVLEHQDRQSLLVEQLEMNLFVLLKPKVFMDGNQYCVLHGEDLQSGIAGFGNTIRTAIYDFNKAFDRELPKKKESPYMAKQSSAPENTIDINSDDINGAFDKARIFFEESNSTLSSREQLIARNFFASGAEWICNSLKQKYAVIRMHHES